MPLINYKIDLKHKWERQRRKIKCFCSDFISKDNQKQSKNLSKGFERSVSNLYKLELT